jgi:hypothetical protein
MLVVNCPEVIGQNSSFLTVLDVGNTSMGSYSNARMHL